MKPSYAAVREALQASIMKRIDFSREVPDREVLDLIDGHLTAEAQSTLLHMDRIAFQFGGTIHQKDRLILAEFDYRPVNILKILLFMRIKTIGRPGYQIGLIIVIDVT